MGRKENNFDLIRVLAAWAVLASHAFPLSYGSNDLEPLVRLSGGQMTLGELAVAIFFIISGYLITDSFLKRPKNPLRFVWARVLRLMPGLIVAVLALAFVAGPILTVYPLRQYLGSASLVRFVGVNLSMIGFWGYLPGVFEGNPYRGVNGSLWTLHYEVWCYGAVLCLGVLRLLNKELVMAALLLGLAVSASYTEPLPKLASYFAGGAAIYLWRPRMSAPRVWACAGVVVATMLWSWLDLALATAGAYLVIFLATEAKPIRLPWRADVSYGTYIWAYPVQQGVVAALGPSWWLNTVVSTPIVLGLAWLSWQFVEAPALALKGAVGVRLPAPKVLR